MSERRFKQAFILLGLVALVIVGSMFSSVSSMSSKPSPDDLLAGQLTDRITRLKDRAATACSGVAANMRQCRELREAANYAYNSTIDGIQLAKRYGDRHRLVSLSQAIDKAEIETDAPLRTLEQSSKTIETMLSGR